MTPRILSSTVTATLSTREETATATGIAQTSEFRTDSLQSEIESEAESLGRRPTHQIPCFRSCLRHGTRSQSQGGMPTILPQQNGTEELLPTFRRQSADTEDH